MKSEVEKIQQLLPKRKNIRLKGFDYSGDGYYFVTVCTHNKENVFGEIVDGEMKLNSFGAFAQNELNKLPYHFCYTELDKYIIMPNHIHAIIIIVGNGLDHSENNKTERSRPFPTIPKILGLYKSGVSRSIHLINPDIKVWQKSYHDHVIRNMQDYQRIWEYINTNPLKWEEDCYYIA